MADPDRRGEHRAAVFEQKGEVGSQSRSEREKQSEDHEKRPGREDGRQRKAMGPTDREREERDHDPYGRPRKPARSSVQPWCELGVLRSIGEPREKLVNAAVRPIEMGGVGRIVGVDFVRRR